MNDEAKIAKTALEQAQEEKERCKKIAARLDATKLELDKAKERIKVLERTLERTKMESADYERLVDAANADLCKAYNTVAELTAKLKAAYPCPTWATRILKALGVGRRSEC